MSAMEIRMISGLVAFLLALVAFWKIFSKAGFPGWLSLLLIVPVVNLIVLYYVAFSTWKTEQF
jgi:hypothetical protein